MTGRTVHPQRTEAESLHRQAIQALTAGKLNEGIALLERAIKAHPKFAAALNDLGTAYWQAGQPARAEKAYAAALQADPGNPFVLNSYGTFFLEQFRLDEADRFLAKAFAIKPDYFEIANNLGLLRFRQGRMPEAEKLFLHATRLNPSWANPYANLGRLLSGTDRQDLAEKAYRHAVQLNPAHASAWSELGDLCWSLREGDEAQVYVEKAIALNPSDAMSWTRLINILEKRSRIDEAQAKLDQAKKMFPDAPGIVIGEARLLRRQGKMAEAAAVVEKYIARISNLPPRSSIVTFFFEAGQLYDRMNDADKAFECFTIANKGQEKLEAKQGVAAECRRNVLHMQETFTCELVQSACAVPQSDRPSPVFLVGFPRSGTTLLDQILTSHPDIEVAEEKSAVDKALLYFVEKYGAEHFAQLTADAGKQGRSPWHVSSPCYPEKLDLLTTADIAEMRRIFYREHGREEGTAGKEVFVDKLPLNLLFAGFIKRMFPDAKFILALRHPCDSVLSCFMQHFKLNPYMERFLDIKDAASFYDEAFNLWDHYTKILDLKVHTIRYEDVVADFQPTVAGLLDFLGVAWDDNVLKFDETAKKRARINTPSYHQVTEKIYTRASGRWLRYRKQLEPVLDILGPHALRHGYSMTPAEPEE